MLPPNLHYREKTSYQARQEKTTMLSLYGKTPLQHFVRAAERSDSDDQPITSIPGKRWREHSVRALRFITLRSFRGEKWQTYKQNALKKAFTHALKRHNAQKDRIAYNPSAFLKADSPLTRFEIIRSIEPIDSALSERISIKAMKKGLPNPTYTHLEQQRSTNAPS
ncbi:MAG: hypothetical protein GDA54_06405 [Alphaproteobacteria bacterium GM7ARS4]|nr:hypothetical protein [Alphaproteobacteria bacterium GM7ARS4]